MEANVAGIFTNSFDKLKNYVRSTYSGLSEYDAEDIVQQTALNMLTRDGLGDVEYVTSYVYTALRNGAKNFFRKRDKEIVRGDIETGASQSLEDELLEMELGEQIMDALHMLDEKSRFVFVETELNGKSYAELAEQTGEPIGTLLSRKSRAAKKMKIILDQYVTKQEE